MIKKLLAKIFGRRKKHKKEIAPKPDTLHGLYPDGIYVPDWIYNGHYDCGDK